MGKTSKHDKRLAFAEKLGGFFEQQYGPRMAGRIFGWLMVCEPEHQTAAQLAEVLTASKGSISTMTRFLLQFGMVDKVRVPGERATYYRCKPSMWMEIMNRKLQMLGMMVELDDAGLALQSAATPERRERLEQMRDFHLFMQREMPVLIERWSREFDKRGRKGGGKR